MSAITVEELKQRMDNNETVNVLDVREEWEFEEFNIGAKLIPLATLPGNLEELRDWKDKEVIVHCKSGVRSASAIGYLKQQGFTNLRNLTGGMVEWRKKFG